MTAVGAPPSDPTRPAAPVALLWVGEVAWGDPRGGEMQRLARAWAEAGALVLHLDPDPGVLQWSGTVPAGSPDVGVQLWRQFMTAWIEAGMRADGPVWVLPWVRSLMATDGQVYTEPAALVEGLAELARARPVVVAPEAGRWTGRSPAVSVVHRAACLGDPPAAEYSFRRVQPTEWRSPWLEVVMWIAPGEEAWAASLAQHLPEASVHLVGHATGEPFDRLLARARALVISPARAGDEARSLPDWLARHPHLAVVGPAPGPSGAAGRVLGAVTPTQYARALGMACWMPPAPRPSAGPWEALWRRLAQGPCPRCVS